LECRGEEYSQGYRKRERFADGLSFATGRAAIENANSSHHLFSPPSNRFNYREPIQKESKAEEKGPKGILNPPGAFTLDPSGKPIS